MNGKFFVILYKENHGDKWAELDGIEYTEKEANAQLRSLKRVCDTGLQFRKKCIYNGPIQVLTVRR